MSKKLTDTVPGIMNTTNTQCQSYLVYLWWWSFNYLYRRVVGHSRSRQLDRLWRQSLPASRVHGSRTWPLTCIGNKHYITHTRNDKKKWWATIKYGIHFRCSFMSIGQFRVWYWGGFCSSLSHHLTFGLHIFLVFAHKPKSILLQCFKLTSKHGDQKCRIYFLIFTHYWVNIW